MVALFKKSRPLFIRDSEETTLRLAPDARPAEPIGDPAERGDVIATIGPKSASTPMPVIDGSERRMFTRKTIHYRIAGKRLDHTLPSLQEPQVSLSLRDLSLGGLSAISEKPIDPGERVAVFFPPQGAHCGWDAYGRIIRCDRGALGYRVAVEFDQLPAA